MAEIGTTALGDAATSFAGPKRAKNFFKMTAICMTVGAMACVVPVDSSNNIDEADGGTTTNSVDSGGLDIFIQDELIYSNMPPVSYRAGYLQGGDNCTIYSGAYTFPGGDSTQLPTDASIDANTDRIANTCATVAVDIESWDMSTPSARKATRDKMAYVIARMVNRKPSLNGKVGFYAAPVRRDYFRAIGCPSIACSTWHDENDDLNFTPQLIAQGITPVFFTSVYLFYWEASPFTKMKAYLDNNIAEGIRMCPQCRQIPFIMPQYHGCCGFAGAVRGISIDNPAVVTMGTNNNPSVNIQPGMIVHLTGMAGASSINNVLLKIGTVDSKTAASLVVSAASPGIVTWASHGLANDTTFVFTAGTLPTGLSLNTQYFVKNAAANEFEIATTKGGASINTSGSSGLATIVSAHMSLHWSDGRPVDGSTLSYTSGGQYSVDVQEDQWLAALQEIATKTKEAVLWGGYGFYWDEKAPWWSVTKNYIEGR